MTYATDKAMNYVARCIDADFRGVNWPKRPKKLKRRDERAAWQEWTEYFQEEMEIRAEVREAWNEDNTPRL
jgi:hypothetical protein